MRKLSCFCAAALLSGWGLLARAEEWPRWRGPDGTGISTEKGLSSTWPADGPKKVWSEKAGEGFASPVAMDGKIYLFYQQGQTDILTAFDADTGKKIWSQSYERGGDPQYPGARATPTIDSTRIYTYGSNGDLTCRELADGKPVWQRNVLKMTNAQPLQWGQASSPLVTDDRVYVQSGQGGDAIAVAIDKATGALSWKSEAKGIGGYAAPILIDAGNTKQLVVFAGQMLCAMDPRSGRTIWGQEWKTSYDVNAATPVYDGSHLFITSDYGHGCLMLEVSAAGVKKLGESKEVQSKFQPPILDGTSLYANSDGTLKCLSWPDGQVKWSAKEHGLRLGAGGSLVRNGDKLITMSERGKLSLVQATPSGYKLLSQVNLLDYDKVWSTPTIYHGKLYAKGKDELVCLDLGGR